MKVVIDIDKEMFEAIKINQYYGAKSDLELLIAEGKPCRERGSLPYDDDKTTCMVCPVCGSVWEVEDEDSNI